MVIDFDEYDSLLIADARQKKYELDKAAVPFDDPRRVIRVAEDTKRRWTEREMVITHICGLRVL